ncbi:MAG: dicarboxylate/amino acid:cation symporter [Planctomycetaceae bacterium]|nr:dicarboxylate/amino acid:cation symporter [Planctomycetaceae bacterium]
MTRLPLHIQIFIALAAGTVVGLLVNPGDIPLPDVSISVAPAEQGGVVVTTAAQDGETRSETFESVEEFTARYPVLAGRLAGDDGGRPFTVEVTKRRLHFTEDRSAIAISYSRRHDKDVISTTGHTESAESLAREYPQWKDVYAKHGGGLAKYATIVSKYVGNVFLRLLKMITIPLIVTSLVTGVAGLGNTGRLGSMFGKTFLYYVTTSVLAITTGIVMVNLIGPGKGAQLPGGSQHAVAGGDQSLTSIFTQLVDNMIPPNPVASLANSQFLSIITFSILLGVFIIRTDGESGKTLRGFFQAGFDVMMRMTMAIISLAPIGVFAFMVYATASQGLEIFLTLGWYMVTVFLALLVHAAVVLPLILLFVARRSPVKFVKSMSPALMTAFSTASSNATLPLTITSVEQRAGVSNRVSSFVLPLGATINMDGTALYEAVAVLFIAQASGMDLTVGQQVLVAVTALLASVGAAGIPHAGLVMMAIVLQAVGLPLEAQGVILAVDRVLDMGRTSVNVWSDSCGCAVLERLEPVAVATD